MDKTNKIWSIPRPIIQPSPTKPSFMTKSVNLWWMKRKCIASAFPAVIMVSMKLSKKIILMIITDMTMTKCLKLWLKELINCARLGLRFMMQVLYRINNLMMALMNSSFNVTMMMTHPWCLLNPPKLLIFLQKCLEMPNHALKKRWLVSSVNLHQYRNKLRRFASSGMKLPAILPL